MNTDNTKEAAIDHTNWMTRDEILSWAQQYFDGQWINAGALETEAGKFADVVAYHAYRAGYTAASAERECCYDTHSPKGPCTKGETK